MIQRSSEIKENEEEIQHALAVYEAEIEYLEEFDSDEIINLLTYRDFLQNSITEHPYLMKPYIKKLHLLDKKLMKSADYIRRVLSPEGQGWVVNIVLSVPILGTSCASFAMSA